MSSIVRITLVFILSALSMPVFSQDATVRFRSSDTALQSAFDRAKQMALHYRGHPEDPVGPWYEAALPARYAFCIRDVSHQCIGAAILGMDRENRNMLEKFMSHISPSKDWCSYWEIDKWDRPAPADYRNDSAFWYNLNANFELIYACERLYRWTGDTSYISRPNHVFFFEKTLNEYIRSWVLGADSLFTRPALPNLPAGSNDKSDNYTRSRGLPSYVENIPGLKISADLVAAIYRGFASYASILEMKGETERCHDYLREAGQYLRQIETKWRDRTARRYHTYYSEDGKFGGSEGAVFLLWYNAIKDLAGKRDVVQQLTSSELNVESMSYLPELLYRDGYGKPARYYLLHLSDPSTPRREYPEVSFGVIEGIVQGLMGIKPDAYTQIIRSYYRGERNAMVGIDSLPVFHTLIGVQHYGKKRSTFTNEGTKILCWQPCFKGRHARIRVNGKALKARTGYDAGGDIFSYINISVRAGQSVTAVAK